MSRAAVNAKKKLRSFERDLERMRTMEHYSAQDAQLVECEECGLQQMNKSDTPCVVCGGEIATFVAFPWQVSRAA